MYEATMTEQKTPTAAMEAAENTAIVAAQQQAIAPADITADAVVDMFLAQYDAADSSIALYRRALRQFFAWIARTGRNTAYMTRADIVAYKKGLLTGEATADGQAKSPLTAASYLNAVRMFYKWLHDNNATITNIAAGVDKPKRDKHFERKPLTEAKAEELLTETEHTGNPRDKAIIELLLKAGLRTIEVVRADIRDMKRIGDDVVLYVQGKGKTSKSNFVPLSAETYTAIAEYLDTRPTATPEAPLFVCGGNRNKDGRLTTRTISGIARRHLDAIGLTHDYGKRNSSYTAHSLRHTYGCAILRATDDYHITQLLLRHASPATTQQYVYHLDEEQRLKAAKRANIDNIYRTAK